MLNNEITYKDIEKKLLFLGYMSKNRARLNLQDINVFAEDFFSRLINLVFDVATVNINIDDTNSDSIDLLDEINKTVYQVTVTKTKRKIENTLGKKGLLKYQNYKLIFVIMVDDSRNLRSNTYNIPAYIQFKPKKDIWDLNTILTSIKSNDPIKLNEVKELINDEIDFSSFINEKKLGLALTKVIQFLYNDTPIYESSTSYKEFKIKEKIDYNELSTAELHINNHKIYGSFLQKKYDEYVKQAQNSETKILSWLNSEYGKLKIDGKKYQPEEIYFNLLSFIEKRVMDDLSDDNTLDYEDIQLACSIILVDAFIKCKIFENPKGYLDHVNAD